MYELRVSTILGTVQNRAAADDDNITQREAK